MSNQRIPPIHLPESYYVRTVRSDGDWGQTWIDGGKSRCETMLADRPPSIVISRPDRNVLYKLDVEAKIYFEIPLGHNQQAALNANIEDDEQWQFVGTAEIDGHVHHKYEAWAIHSESKFPRKYVFVDPESKMRRRIVTINNRGEQVLTVDCYDAVLGPQPDDVFEPPPDYTQVTFP